MFYGQSWLLVHYLQTGRKGHPFAAENDAYLTAVETGKEPIAAFEDAFGIPVNELHTTLSRYAATDMRHFVFTLKQPFVPAPAVVAPVAPSSIAAQLAGLLFVRGAADSAKPYLEAAITLDPRNGAALVALGDLHKFAGRFDEAQPYYEKAIAAEPKNAYHELDYGEFFLTKAKADRDAEAVANNLIEARRHFARSDALDPTVPETLAENGATYLFPGQSIDKGIASLAAAQEMLPSQLEIAGLLARAYAMGNQREKAVQLLRASLAWRDSEDADTQAARKLLEEWSAPADQDDPVDDSAETAE
jgi:tetratricopeptide (TPR) repeat protein